MKRNPRYFSVCGAMRANLAVSLLAAGAFVGAAASAHASLYQLTSLVTDDMANNNPSVTGLCWSIPLSHDPAAGVLLLSGVGARPPPDGV
jgi:hypothetical protein